MSGRVYLGYVSWDLYILHGFSFVETAFAGAKGLKGFRGVVLEATDSMEMIRVFAEVEGGSD